MKIRYRPSPTFVTIILLIAVPLLLIGTITLFGDHLRRFLGMSVTDYAPVPRLHPDAGEDALRLDHPGAPKAWPKEKKDAYLAQLGATHPSYSRDRCECIADGMEKAFSWDEFAALSTSDPAAVERSRAVVLKCFEP